MKHVRLLRCNKLTDNGLMEACKSLPLLEELDISYCVQIQLPFESVGCSCPNLKIFQFGIERNSHSMQPCNDAAHSIAKNMPGLRELQLFGNQLDKEGMRAILDGCPLLQSLDVRHCF